jgi:alkaline phosphatase isozyme conversion protein
VEATNWSLGKKDGYQQRANRKPSRTAQAGMTCSWIISSILIRAAGRIEHRSRDVVKVMLPLVKELAKAGKAENGGTLPSLSLRRA